MSSKNLSNKKYLTNSVYFSILFVYENWFKNIHTSFAYNTIL